jgi:DNA mismatch endonuclease (patch repair protein)
MRPELYPQPANASVTAAMKANRSSDTRPEMELRSALHRLGCRFRKNYVVRLPERRVRIDVAFPQRRVAVFSDGCFWHACPEHGHAPRRNVHYWGPKLERNVRRDREITRALEEAGWRVLRIWEHVPAEEGARAVAAVLKE